MDFNGDVLGDIQEVIEAFKSHKYTLINGKKANVRDVCNFITLLAVFDPNYTLTIGTEVVEIEYNGNR